MTGSRIILTKMHKAKTFETRHYFGQPQRNLNTQIDEHNHVISASNITDVTKHLWQNPDHLIDINNSVVLFFASDWRKL